MGLSTVAVSMAVTPTVVSTFFSHYLKRSPLRQKPTAHLPYDQGLHLIRSFLVFASHHTVEDVQAFMAQWVPAPSWIRTEIVNISDEQLARAAAMLETQLGPEGLRRVGGKQWWQWRRPKSLLQAEWIEMKSHHAERKRKDNGKPARRVMFYVHGGAYFMGSVDEHRYQLQRHARKLKARVFAPRYRLAPQFPFPCGLHDCLAAYLQLLSLQDNDASTIILAGDSAGGGMVLSMLVIMRDRGIPLPAGGILISPWVDLTHSFPSLTGEPSLDYIPPYGFHQRPSMAWPPPSEAVLEETHKLNAKARVDHNAKKKNSGSGSGASAPPLSDAEAAAEEEAARAMFTANNLKLVADDGSKEIQISEQIQLYTTNNILDHPLVSPALQSTLGGLPPLLVMAGGGELLRDEQIYIAHKCANPTKYAGPEATLTDEAKAQIARYPPTDVQLQVWDDLCHVAPTLSFTRPAKFMFRSIAQFGAWALARAQKTEIDILDDDNISIISTSSSDMEAHADSASPAPGPVTTGAAAAEPNSTQPNTASNGNASGGTTANSKNKNKQSMERNPDNSMHIGKAGDPLPPFKNHIIRQRVTRHGDVFPLAAPRELPGTQMALERPHHVGVPKQGPVDKWTAAKLQWDNRYARDRNKVLKKRLHDAAVGFESFGTGEHPPPSALAGRIKIGEDLTEHGTRKLSHGLALWSLWGSKHDEATVEREKDADEQDANNAAAASASMTGAAAGETLRGRGKTLVAPHAINRSQSRHRIVRDEHQADGQEPMPAAKNDTESGVHSSPEVPVTNDATATKAGNGLLSPGDAATAGATVTGVTGKRPFLGGIALPFTLNKEADTASMVTLHSRPETPSAQISPMAEQPPGPMSPFSSSATPAH